MAKVIIAGGGIGGLVSALHLHRAGIDCEVFESSAAMEALGVGINLLPHAVRELTILGLDHALAEAAIATRELTYVNKFGQTIWSEPRGRDAGYPWPQYSIHRGRLQMLLYEAVRERLGPAAVRTGYQLSTFREHSSQVEAEFVERRTGEVAARASGDALIGADGIHSTVRKHFYPNEGAPRFSGRMLWRAMSEAEPFLGGRTMIMAGHANQKFVAYPICPQAAARGRSLVNWVAELHVGGDEAPVRRDWNRRVDKSVFEAAFRTWRFGWLDVPSLIESATEVFEFPMVDRDPVPRWTFGRVTLLGDAAHPMYPIGSNGASQAILDAAALADSLAACGSVEQALVRYEQARLGPTAAIVQSNRRHGPEVVMQLAEERAPQGFDHIDDAIPRAELEEIAARYKQVAGFDRQTLVSK